MPSTGEALHGVSLADLACLWHSYEGQLSEAGSAPEQATIATTACGLGTLSDARRVPRLELLKRLPDAVE